MRPKWYEGKDLADLRAALATLRADAAELQTYIIDNETVTVTLARADAERVARVVSGVGITSNPYADACNRAYRAIEKVLYP